MNVRNLIDSRNDDILEYVNSLSIEEIGFRLNKLVIHSLATHDIHDALEDVGIVLLEDFFTQQEIDYLSEYGSRLHQEILKKEWPKLKTYSDKVGCIGGYAEIRDGNDKGMIDAFHVDRILEIKDDIREKLESFVRELFGNEPTIRYNAYFNDGVQKTRGFHHDSLNDDYKLFVYLTNVNKGDGPYMYEVGSHRRNYRLTNLPWRLFKGFRTESPKVRLENLVPLYAKAGTVIISNQRGNHRGYPQDKSGHRKLLSIRIE